MLVPIGFENFVNTSLIVTILKAGSSQARKLIQTAEDERRLINATCGRKAGCIILMKSKHIVLSVFDPTAIKSRIENLNLDGEASMTTAADSKV